MKPVSPSKLARTIAAQEWPDVHQQSKVAKGVYQFSCAGHGGLIGIVSELDVKPEVIEAARKAGLITLVARIQHSRRYTRTYSVSHGYREADLRKTKENHPNHVELVEVWIGEEDCGWATLAYASSLIRDSLGATRDEVRELVETYNADFAEALS